ncbi:hypothetical protein AN216_15090 [Streptomyces oceani]|uniref:Secreted protein n=1 Tax=Streptomyces oceani TaxID=1075402 RepID=A0A1E7KG57_9ACTN|nr:hypothetical protein AN216_15090 [Streptomyces oceani]
MVDAADTPPGRLRIRGAVLALLIIASGAVTTWQLEERSAAADDVLEHSHPLSADAASIHRSLAHANTMASIEFLAGQRTADAKRAQDEKDIRTASELLTRATANSRGSVAARRQITKLSRELPRHTGLVETARANDRQGLPLGGSHLRYANERRQDTLLPATEKLYATESARLSEDRTKARDWPLHALGLGLGLFTLVTLLLSQRHLHRRTNRVRNPGLLTATAAVLGVLLWLTGAHAVAQSRLDASDQHGAESPREPNETWTGSLQARGAENMWLVARGSGGGKYEKEYQRRMREVAGGQGVEGRLDAALALADDRAGRRPVEEAMEAVRVWQERHQRARDQETSGNHEKAVDLVIDRVGSTGATLDTVDTALREAAGHEQREFERAASSGRAALTALPVGAAALALLATPDALLAFGRSVAEYR